MKRHFPLSRENLLFQKKKGSLKNVDICFFIHVDADP